MQNPLYEEGLNSLSLEFSTAQIDAHPKVNQSSKIKWGITLNQERVLICLLIDRLLCSRYHE